MKNIKVTLLLYYLRRKSEKNHEIYQDSRHLSPESNVDLANADWGWQPPNREF
jgi:hypothetical protein